MNTEKKDSFSLGLKSDVFSERKEKGSHALVVSRAIRKEKPIF